MTTIGYACGVADTLAVGPAHMSDKDWGTIRSYLETARQAGEVVDLSTRTEMLTPAQVAERLGMSRSTMLRRIAEGELKAVKVGTHHRIPMPEFERFSHELMRQMAEMNAADINAEFDVA